MGWLIKIYLDAVAVAVVVVVTGILGTDGGIFSVVAIVKS